MGLVQLPQVVWDSRWDSEMECQNVHHTQSLLTPVSCWKDILGWVFFSLSETGVMKQLMGAGRAVCTHFCLCFIIHHFLIGVTGPEHSHSDYGGGEKWCMKPVQSFKICPLRFLGFVCTGHIHLSQVTVFFLSAVSAVSHIYPSSGIAVVVLAEQGACVCRAQVRRLLNLDLKCWLYPKKFFLCDWKPWDAGYCSAPRSGGTSG